MLALSVSPIRLSFALAAAMWDEKYAKEKEKEMKIMNTNDNGNENGKERKQRPVEISARLDY